MTGINEGRTDNGKNLTNKDGFIITSTKNIERIKAWKEQNHERLIEEVICGCGGKFKYCKNSEHTRTKKHTAWLELNVPDDLKPQ